MTDNWASLSDDVLGLRSPVFDADRMFDLVSARADDQHSNELIRIRLLCNCGLYLYRQQIKDVI